MIQGNFIKSLTENQSMTNKAVQLKPGQIFKGKVTKFFPNQMAQVQLGGMTIHARLQVALSAHQQYWFEVQPNKQVVELKVLEGGHQRTGQETKDSPKDQGNQLLKSLGLSETKSNQKLVQHLVEQRVPFSKAELQQAANLLKGSKTIQTGIDTIQTMVEKNLPFSKSVFQSIESVHQNPSISKLLTNALEGLQNQNTSEPALKDVKQFMQQLGSNLGKAENVASVLQLLKQWANKESPNHYAAQAVMQKLGMVSNQQGDVDLRAIQRDLSGFIKGSMPSTNPGNRLLSMIQAIENIENTDVRFQATQTLLKSMNSSMSIESFQKSLDTLLNQGVKSAESQLVLSDKEKLILQQVNLNNISNPKENNTHTLLKQWLETPEETQQHQLLTSILKKSGLLQGKASLDSLFQNMKLAMMQEGTTSSATKMEIPLPSPTLSAKEFVLQALNNMDQLPSQQDKSTYIKWFSNKLIEAGTLTGHEKQLLESMSSKSIPTIMSNQSDVASALKRLITNFGFDHESTILKAANSEQAIDKQSESLKPLIIKALNESENLPSSVRNQLETLLNRITGQQLLTSDSNGQMQHLLMQFPLKFGSFLTDATIQWSGKKKQNGELDPNHCRIVFYLELETLKQTMIDVQVQNRVINIRLYNENTDMKNFVPLFTPILKENLAKANYQLSSVKVIDEFIPKQEKQAQQTPASNGYFKPTYTGVDYRV